ncbi:putative bifunctional diguanylate cyclase/phosphodiesterase [Novosphingobium album (ex Liu et al. 2023)]|uniref:EAL domain-containing protein n=1 Tax=Novosphingobium album (ex Liu et al. 2023) TaxID=3031130 RepID=A0ABT5WPX2_9SPHN|nr:EAL domain-containing protein [Novosphingobium album (ex Liu et al. 2023)]MDE8652087.1 EAL domain-containing protein [Novosphingobium album (ex Liu et al. 2023)]
MRGIASLPARLWNGVVGSLERRLVSAIVVIIACTVGLQVVSQDRALALREESDELRTAVSMSEHGEQLLKAMIQFHLASRNALDIDTDSEGAAHYAADLTDTAMQIEEHVNALRLDGLAAYDMQSRSTVFSNLDRLVGQVIDRPQGRSRADEIAIERRLDRMMEVANRVHEEAERRRDTAYGRVEQSTRQWYLLVSLVGLLTLGFTLAILVDVSRNILPALRRMHRSLERLADGDLEIEIEPFRLRELSALSRSLETFRRNAVAVKNLAFTDPATGLPNRRAFVEQAGRLLAQGPRLPGSRQIVALIDIDKFKYINDDYGHASGDMLVLLLGRRMKAFLGEQSIVARVGGDEFAVLVEVPQGTVPANLCGELIAAMRAPFDFEGFAIAVTVSLGFVEAQPDHAAEVNRLLHQADLALYAAKREGRNRVSAFTPPLEQEREVDRALERDLAQALARGELRMVYQPICPIRDDACEVEALVRWNHAVLGEISPAQFIPAAERSGQMPQLGAWIIERALSDLSRWPTLTMSINLSPLQLQQDGFVGFLLDCCRRNRIEAHRVFLEVTETVSIERNTRALLTLELLRNAGFRIALDDFGTGYSSLCMMKSFRFDRLKLDRTLVKDLGTDATSRAVFDAAVQMARQIGAEVVAEGVSDENLVAPALAAGCTHLQGFHFSRPIEAEAIEDYYRASQAAARQIA